MFVSYAYATADTAAPQGSLFITAFPFLLIFALMYFMIIRPQKAQLKKKQEQLAAIRRGDVIVTGGGVVGRVTKVFDDLGELEVEVAEGVRVRVLRYSITDVRAKAEVAVETGAPNV